MSTTSKKGVSDFELERLLRGELDDRAAASVRERLRAAGEEGRLEALAASDQEILARYTPADVSREVRRRKVMAEAAGGAGSGASRRRAPWILPLAGSLAAACALWLFVRPAGPQPGGTTERRSADRPYTYTGIKGDPALHVFRQTAREPEKLDVKTHVRPGDVLQIRYIADGDRFGFIASVDAHGAVNLHLPENGGPAAPIEPSGERAVPHAYELDSTPGFERFVFVSSTSPFDTRPFAEALAAGKPLPQSPRVRVTELTLRKDTP